MSEIGENRLKEQLARILGADRVSDDPETLEAYSKDQSFTPQLRPSAVARPGNKAEVQAVVAWANETATPLVPVSSGPPHLRGDTVPSVGGAVMVDVSGMKRIIKIDRKNRMALVEPGVTFGELAPQVAKAGMKLSMPLLPRASKSVLTSVLEREPMLTPKYQWQILDPLRFIEVVWGSGEMLRTGESGLYRPLPEDEPLKQTFPLGPLQTDYYRLVSGAQGSMGIVVWGAVKCEITPQIHNFFFVPSDTPGPLMDMAYTLLRFRYGDELFLMNNVQLAYILGENAAEIEALKEDLPQWVLVFAVAGRERLPEDRVAYQQADMGDIARKFGVKMLPALGEVNGSRMAKLLAEPCAEPHWKVRYKGASEEIFFLTTLDRTPDFVKAINAALEARKYPVSDVGVYAQPSQQGASCHLQFTLPYDPTNAKDAKNMKETFRAASEAVLDQGAYFSRPYGIWSHMAYNKDMQSTMTLMKIKGIFDPRNVMNPGRLFDSLRQMY